MLAWIMAAGAVVCLIYFLIIVVYAGIGTSYVGIWLAAAAFLGMASYFTYRWQRDPEHTILRIPVSMISLCLTGVVIMLVLQILIFGSIPRSAARELDYVIVLGAKTHSDGSLSKTLKYRLDKASDYVLQNPNTVLILSGGQGRRECEPEAETMQKYLLDKGVPELQMLLEIQSSSTVENIAYSRVLISDMRAKEREKLDEQHQKQKGVRELPEHLKHLERYHEDVGEGGLERPVRVGILTSNFHLFRAMQIAKKQNMYHISGIASKSDPVLLVHMAVRDALAVLKDRLAGNL